MSRGSIIKRGSTSSVVLDLGRGPDGRRVRRWHSGYRIRKDAERARTELLARGDQGAYVEPSRLTLAAFLRQRHPGGPTDLSCAVATRHGLVLRPHGSVGRPHDECWSLVCFVAEIKQSGR